MNNKIYYLGIISVFIVLIGSLFKISHWPGAGIIFSVGNLFFCLVFLPPALISSFRSESSKKLHWLYFTAFVSIIFDFAGALFKVMHWPGASIVITIGIPLPFVTFLPLYIIYNRNDKQINYNNVTAVLFFFAYMGAMTALLSLNVSKNILDESVKNIQSLESKITLTDNINRQIINQTGTENADVMALNNKANEISGFIEEIRAELIKNENPDVSPAPDQIDNYKAVSGKDNRSVSQQILVNSGRARILKDKIDKYFQLASSLVPGQPALVIPSDEKTSENSGQEDWFTDQFKGRILISTIELLYNIEYQVKISEMDILGKLVVR